MVSAEALLVCRVSPLQLHWHDVDGTTLHFRTVLGLVRCLAHPWPIYPLDASINLLPGETPGMFPDFPKSPWGSHLPLEENHSSRESETWFSSLSAISQLGDLEQRFDLTEPSFVHVQNRNNCTFNCTGLFVRVELGDICKAFISAGKQSSLSGSYHHH